MLASLIASLQDLTPLIVAFLATGLLLLFRPQIVQLVARLTRLRANVGHMQLDADLAQPEDLDADESEDVPATSTGQVSEAGTPGAILSDQVVAPGEQNDQNSGDILKSDDPAEVRNAMITAMVAKDDERAKALLARLRAIQTDNTENQLDRARYLALRQRFFNDDHAGAALKRLADDESIRPPVLNMVGLAMADAGEPSAAAALFAEAAAGATNDEQRVQYLIHQASSLTSAGDPAAAVALLESKLAADAFSSTADLWEALASAYEAANKPEPRALALQQALKERPNDQRLRFDVAYAASTSDDDSLRAFIVHHYTHLVSQAPNHEWALNNLGVQYRRLDMPLNAVSKYEAARDQKNTLAMANLASHYMQGGFGSEAEQVLGEASREEKPHANVGAGLAELARLRETEAEQRSAILQAGQEQAEFLSRYIQARVRSDPGAFIGDWIVDDGAHVQVGISGRNLTANWSLNGKKFRAVGEACGETGKLEYEEMSYFSSGGEQRELGYRRQATDRWLLTPDHKAIEVMRVKAGTEVELLRLPRV